MENEQMTKDYEPSELIVSETKKWLGKDGHDFFSEVYDKYGTLIAVWRDGGIPHPVHWREGMTVRNFLRGLDETKGWSGHDFDNRWEVVVLKAIGEK